MKNGMFVDENGTKRWYLNGGLHRVGGPAVEWPNGTKDWCLNDKLHRLDGPAVEYSNGVKEWYIDGQAYTESEFKKKIEGLNCLLYIVEYEILQEKIIKKGVGK